MSVSCLGWCNVTFPKHYYVRMLLKRLSSSKRQSPPINHYQVLGLNSKSTQAEVKAAFYKLSKIFHPDVSDQSEDSTLKFRQITAAYEILGNLKLRKMYDRGLLPRDGINPDVEMEYEAPVVKTPFKKTKYQPATGRTTVYDFDQWSRVHYGAALNRRAAAKEKWEAQGADSVSQKGHQQSESFIVVILLALIMLISGMHYMESSNLDVPVVVENNKKP